MQKPETSRVRWLLIFWMFLVSAIAYLDRVNIAIAAPSLAKEFGIDNIHLGWVFSAFVIGYALFQTPGGALADKIGPRKVLGLGVIWWAVFTVLVTFLSAGTGALLLVLIIIRFSLGMGEAVVYPASNCVVAAWIPSSERGMANGIIFTGVGVGAGLAAPFVSYLVGHYGWRAPFWASALLGLIAGAIWYVIARDKPSQHPWISTKEEAYIKAGLPPEGPNLHDRKKLSWSTILSDSRIWSVTFSYFAFGYVAYIFFSWFYIYLNTVRHLDLKQSAFYSMVPPLGMAVGSLCGGFISDRLTAAKGKRVGRCFLAAGAIFVCALLLAFGTQVDSAPLATMVLGAGACALYVAQSSFWSISADIGKSSAGSVSGFMNMGGQLGGALTASLTPLIARDYGWTASFLVAAALCAAGALAWLPVNPERAGDSDKPELAYNARTH